MDENSVILWQAEVHNQRMLNIQQQGFLNQANITNDSLRAENQQLRQENDYYKMLLTKPMHEIANANGAFRETYEKQQENTAKWVVKQQGFKNLLLVYAARLGIEKDEINRDLDAGHNKAVDDAAEEYPSVAKVKDKFKK